MICFAIPMSKYSPLQRFTDTVISPPSSSTTRIAPGAVPAHTSSSTASTPRTCEPQRIRQTPRQSPYHHHAPDRDPHPTGKPECPLPAQSRYHCSGAMCRANIRFHALLHDALRFKSAKARIKVTTQVPKTTIGGLQYAGTTWDVGGTVTKPGI